MSLNNKIIKNILFHLQFHIIRRAKNFQNSLSFVLKDCIHSIIKLFFKFK
jgi:hypothetical protein